MVNFRHDCALPNDVFDDIQSPKGFSGEGLGHLWHRLSFEMTWKAPWKLSEWSHKPELVRGAYGTQN